MRWRNQRFCASFHHLNI